MAALRHGGVAAQGGMAAVSYTTAVMLPSFQQVSTRDGDGDGAAPVEIEVPLLAAIVEMHAAAIASHAASQ